MSDDERQAEQSAEDNAREDAFDAGTERVAATPVCDKPGCERPMTGYDAWGQWCDDHNGGRTPDAAYVRFSLTIC